MSDRKWTSGAALLLLLAHGSVDGEVFLKSRERGAAMPNRMWPGKSRSLSRRHLLLDFRQPPTGETAAELQRRGMRVVSYLPSTGMLVAVDGEPDLRGLELEGMGLLEAADRLSPLVRRSASRAGAERRPRGYVVEFHADVAWQERRALLQEHGVELLDHPDLVGQHMLVRGRLQQMQALAEWDEVAYIFPASAALLAGTPLIGCLNGATPAGQVGQLTQRVGEGWDGPGLGTVDLGYTIQSFSRKLDPERQRAEIERAMAAWARAVKVRWVAGTSMTAMRNVNILFGGRAHGDAYPFDGAGKTLAHTFYPAPPNPEPIAGDMHFDEDERWQIGTDIDLYSVALHELGHALGLGHSDSPGSVMYPYYRQNTDLSAEDIASIRMLYEEETDPAPDIPVIPDPPETPTDPSTPTEPETPSTPAPVLEILSPAPDATVENSLLPVTGTVISQAGTPVVQWVTNSGFFGTARVVRESASRYRWTIDSMALAPGRNVVSLTVTDAGLRTDTKTLTVTYVPAGRPDVPTQPDLPDEPTQPGSSDIKPPVLRLISPATTSMLTQMGSIAVRGTATDDVGVVEVRWECSCERSGVASGTTTWTVLNLPLKLGVNVLTFRARDAAGNTAVKTLTVMRL